MWTTFFDKATGEVQAGDRAAELQQVASRAHRLQGRNGAPNAAEQTAYQQWADGLAERAQKVTDPELAAQATQLAQLANQFVIGLPRMRADTEARAPGAPAPAVVYEMSALNDQITAQSNQLSKACS